MMQVWHLNTVVDTLHSLKMKKMLIQVLSQPPIVYSPLISATAYVVLGKTGDLGAAAPNPNNKAPAIQVIFPL